MFFSELLPIPVLSPSEMNCTWEVRICALSCCLYHSIRHHESAHFSLDPWVQISRATAGLQGFPLPLKVMKPKYVCVAYSKLQLLAFGLVENK